MSLSLLILVMSALLAGQSGAAMPQVWIEQNERGDGMVELVGYAKSDAAVSGEFSLTVVRQTGGSSARTRQGGQVNLRGGRTEQLSVVSVGPVTSPDDWHAWLELSVDGSIVAVAEAPHPARP